VRPDPMPLRCLNPGAGRVRLVGLFIVENTWDVEGYAVYIMVVIGEFKKAGHTGKGAASFKNRMNSSLNCLRTVISGRGPANDPFKRHATDLGTMLEEEDSLNNHYRGEWTKEGWTKDGLRRSPAATPTPDHCRPLL